MNLLPKSSTEFNSKNYWNEFFSKRGTKSFEWYGEYVELYVYLHKYIKPADKLLVAGCGSSSISGDLFKSGYHHITNVDISEIVIRQMKEKYGSEYPEMKWIEGNLYDLKLDSDSFSCVLDKGTLDALITTETEKAAEQTKQYFQEVGKILRIGGRYICISLLQEHILSALLDWFPERGWLMRFCRCEDAEKSKSADGRFSFPVFMVVCTKFKVMNNFQPIIELNIEDQIQRTSAALVKETIVSLQQFALLKHNLRNKVVAGEDINLDLYDYTIGEKRYKLFVVDSPKSSNKLHFAVFIVPQGRESEYLFNSSKGQHQLAASAGTNRLVVVHLMRGQSYGTVTDVQNELHSKVLELAPAKLPNNFKIPFLSVGNDLGERKEVFRGRSSFSGEYIVEDVKDDSLNAFFRRLIFLHNQNLIQSEAKFIQDKKKKKRKTNSEFYVIDHSYLACTHHTIMLASYEIASPESSTLLVGLGGGSLAMYIHKYFPKVKLTVVDIDEEIVNVAKNWFSFKTDARLACEVEDGIHFVRNAADEGLKFDVIMFDIDSKELCEGLSCPPKQFISTTFLSQVSQCINENGLFTLNLVCRNMALRESILNDLQEVFPCVFYVSIPEEVNIIVFCRLTKSLQPSAQHFEKDIKKLNSYLVTQTKATDDVIELVEMIKNFHVL